MIDKSLSEIILTIGTPYYLPKGGIAQVIKTYHDSVFACFKFVGNGGGKNKVHSLWILVSALFNSFLKFSFDRKIRIVHIHTASYRSFTHTGRFVNLAKLFHKKVVLHIHGGGFDKYYQEQPDYVKSILEKSDCVVALTEKWKSFFRDTVGLKNVEVVNNVVDQPRFQKVIKNAGVLDILFLGFIVDTKGIFDLVEMIGEHKRELEGKLLLHVGGSGELEKMNGIIQKYGIEALVKYEGWVSGEKKVELLNLCDAFILPSYVEGLPISILEAMAYETIVIATPVGGIPDLLNNNNSFLISPGDKNAMFNVILSIIKDRNGANAKVLNAKSVIEDYLPDSISRRLSCIYSNLLR